MSSKDDIIAEIYYDEAGYGSIKQTYTEAKQKDNWIPLHISSQNGHFDIVKYLVKKGAEIGYI